MMIIDVICCGASFPPMSHRLVFVTLSPANPQRGGRGSGRPRSRGRGEGSRLTRSFMEGSEASDLSSLSDLSSIGYERLDVSKHTAPIKVTLTSVAQLVVHTASPLSTTIHSMLASALCVICSSEPSVFVWLPVLVCYRGCTKSTSRLGTSELACM